MSVLLDAGAGPTWRYISTSDGKVYNRSEGLAMATFEMFMQGMFSSDTAMKHRVNAHGLTGLTLETVERGFQVHQANQLIGLEGRIEILHRLGEALSEHKQIFGEEIARPGNLIDYMLSKHPNKEIPVTSLWAAMYDLSLCIKFKVGSVVFVSRKDRSRNFVASCTIFFSTVLVRHIDFSPKGEGISYVDATPVHTMCIALAARSFPTIQQEFQKRFPGIIFIFVFQCVS